MINQLTIATFLILMIFVHVIPTVLCAQLKESPDSSNALTADKRAEKNRPRNWTINRNHGALPRVMLLVFEPNSDEVLRIVETLQLHMFEVDVKFGVRWVKPPTNDYGRQLATAHKLIDEENLQLVFFWNSTDRNVLYYIGAESPDPMKRKIDDVGDESRPEAISIVVQTAIESLIEYGETTDEPPQETPQPKNQTEPKKHVEKKSTPPRANRVRSSRPRKPHIYSQLGYSLDFLNSVPDVLHAGNIRIGYQPIPAVRAYMGIGFTSQITSREDDVFMKQLRLPIEIGALAMLSRSSLVIGGGGAFLIVPVRNSPGKQIDDPDMKNMYWSQGVMMKIFLECQYRFSEYFEIFADIHLLVDLNMITYSVPPDGPVLFDEYRRLWPGFQVGITFFIF